MKKAQIEITNIVLAYLGFFLFLIIFILIFGVAKGCSMAKMQGTYKYEIVGQINLNTEANLQLVNFLRTPKEFETTKTISDLIVLWAKNDYAEKYAKPIVSEGHKIFDKVYGDRCYFLFISTDLNPDFSVLVGPSNSDRLAFGEGSNVDVVAHRAPSAYIPFIDKDDASKLVMISLDLTEYFTMKSRGYSEAKIKQECNK